MNSLPLEYARALAAALEGVLHEALAAVYLHGSGAMGGWLPQRSDIDVLAVSTRSLTEEEKQRVAFETHPERLPCPGTGLELSILNGGVLKPLTARPPFELHITTGANDAKMVDGSGHAGDSDLVMHFAVTRARGIAVFGPAPTELLPDVVRDQLVAALADELGWAARNAAAEYMVLNACRAWRYAETGELVSKLEGGEWALARVAPQALITEALALQRGEPGRLDPVAARAFALDVQNTIRPG